MGGVPRGRGLRVSTDPYYIVRVRGCLSVVCGLLLSSARPARYRGVRYALVNGERVEAARGIAAAVCPGCEEPVIAHCGELIANHWKHKSLSNCDTWGEMSEWHFGWQDRFPVEWREVSMGEHRADVKIPGGPVIEFQHSTLTLEELRQRVDFYGSDMVWVWDVADAWNAKRIDVDLRPSATASDDSFRVEWNRAKKVALSSGTTTYFDYGGSVLFRVGRVIRKSGVFEAERVTKDAFVAHYRDGVPLVVEEGRYRFEREAARAEAERVAMELAERRRIDDECRQAAALRRAAEAVERERVLSEVGIYCPNADKFVGDPWWLTADGARYAAVRMGLVRFSRG